MQPILQIRELELSYPNQLLFSNFSYTVYPGQKIAIIGNNGSGKSALLKSFTNLEKTPITEVIPGNGLVTAYVPQIIAEYNTLSGAERFNQALSTQLSKCPDLLLLDEPTNHLDLHNRKSLFNMLKHSPVTQIIVTHDLELLNSGIVDNLWHIHDQKITIFQGRYSDYLANVNLAKQQLEQQIDLLNKDKYQQHQDLMREQQRAKKSREQGEKSISNRKWPTITSAAKARRAETTAGRNNAALQQQKQQILDKQEKLWQPEELTYKFGLTGSPNSNAVVTISNGSCYYSDSAFKLERINLAISAREKIALCGANSSGKSTLVKAILKDPAIYCSGEWLMPKPSQIAYLDQHYSNLKVDKTLLATVQDVAPHFSYSELRNFLNKFLFRKNEEINKSVAVLSGGEKARLSLALIALQCPKLLILDEVSNNIDLMTRQYITELLKNYPGTMIVISHDPHFLEEIGITNENLKFM